jgi:hypothetical protein
MCALNPVFVDAVAAQQDPRSIAQLRGRIGLHDEASASLIRLLVDGQSQEDSPVVYTPII